MIGLADISYRYPQSGEYALKGVGLEVKKGECVLVTGAAGAGKTTLCLAAAGILYHEYAGRIEGRVFLAGRDVRDYKDMGELGRHVGVVFDDPDSQLIFTTVEEEILSGLEHRDLKPEEVEERLESILKATKLCELRDRAPHTLSGGQKQRVAIAATLALGTDALILDEPTSELDEKATKIIVDVLSSLKNKGVAILLVEHKLSQVLDIVDRTFHLQKGVLEEIEDPISALKNGRIDDVELMVPAYAHTEGAAFKKCPAKPIIKVENLTHIYGDLRAIDRLDLEVCAGECVAIVGDNGSGKTTLIKHFNGLLRPTDGKVMIRGIDASCRTTTDLSKDVGLVFQNPDTMLFADTVRDEVAFGVCNLGLRDPEKIVDDALSQVKLSSAKDLYPRALSRGERQRLAIACVLAMQPSIVILDEPTTGLDFHEAQDIMALLKALQRKGHTIIMVTHSLEIVEKYTDRRILMKEGRIVSDTGGGL